RPISLFLHGESFGYAGFDRHLRDLARSDERVKFAGPYDHNQLRSVLEPLDAVLIPSLWYENYPISAAIAVAAGVPVIGSDAGGVRELIDSFKCGFTFRLGDPEDLA